MPVRKLSVVLLLFVFTSVNAQLLDRLRDAVDRVEEAVDEMEQSIEEIGDDSDSTTSQSQASQAPSLPANTAPASDQTATSPLSSADMYGWLDRVNYSDRPNPLLADLPLNHTSTQISIGVLGVTTRVTKAIQCNAVILDRPLPEISGIDTGDLAGKSLSEIDQAFNPFRGTFIRLSDVTIHESRNQKFCVPASVSVVESMSGSNVAFNGVNNQYLRTAFDVIARAGLGDVGSNPHLKPAGNQWLDAGPTNYDCNQYRWSSAEAANLMSEEFLNRDIQSAQTADIEFIGVRPVLDQGPICEFEAMSISVSGGNVADVDRSLSFDSLTVTIVSIDPSRYDVCMDRAEAIGREPRCDEFNTPAFTAPSLLVAISREERERTESRLKSEGFRAYWRNGIAPRSADSLRRDQTVVLTNVSLDHDRAGEASFEFLSIVD